MTLSVSRWFNTPEPVRLDDLRGRPVVLYAFQMLCPSCVHRATPVVEKLHRQSRGRFTVVGLHTVFEHHDGMRPESLSAYLHEFDVTFPVGVDEHEDGHSAPVTMRRLGLRGTPSILLLDAGGQVRQHLFGAPDELTMGLALGGLLADRSNADHRSDGDDRDDTATATPHAGCTDDACEVAA
ncbi:TlpA disulfide reductase family protein [Virgisporangium ochraceum]|uniref:Alkyl hydroperoxide reductase subunit C/ Thiol specific antioxidant domain-containing protein n=1 Tax=Virgisporangium ochraceum TaxID=65505 RepID=A0A8J3ZV02_9ACTN|nr:TlpA disulfide reductase family protein [Virgisporangium ochraceum]GIJ70439.1 hypothetical protein Voc01_053560 [Virgisporangium ochraceum]